MVTKKVLIEINKKDLPRLKEVEIEYTRCPQYESEEGFIPVPSMNLEIAEEKTHLGKNWYEVHEALAKEDSRMLTIPEFVNFLNYLRENPSRENTQIYKDITQAKEPWRAEWLDAYFEKRKDGLYVLTGNQANFEKGEDGLYVLTGNQANPEKLENVLMEDQTPGISLDSWLKNSTSQGLPRLNIAKGNLNHYYPKKGGVAQFVAYPDGIDLHCDLDPSARDTGPILGVRAAKVIGRVKEES